MLTAEARYAMARRQTGGRLRAVLFLVASLGVAGLAVAMVFRVVRSYQAELIEATAPEETIQVVRTKHKLFPGVTIVAEDLEPVVLPPDYIPDSVLRQPEEAIGRVPRESILAKEFIRQERLADPTAGLGLNAIIPRGMRALSINISEGSAVSGFLNPGNYVDVVVTLQPLDGKPSETFTMMQAVTVLAVNNRLGDSANPDAGPGRPSVTLAVTPEQAEKLTHAFNQTRMVLTLRNDIDVTNVNTNGAIAEELLGGANGEKRINIKEWRERTRQQQDGSLIIIRGTNQQTSPVPAGQ